MKKYAQFITENKGRTFDTRYYYAVYTNARLKEITGPYKSEDSAWYDHGGDMDEILKGDEIQNLMNKGKYKDYTLRLMDKPV
jgi:hypothetical protein